MAGSSSVAVLAVHAEAEPLLRRVAVLSTETAGGWTVRRTRLGARDVLIVACGVGKVNAAMAAQSIIERCEPAAIISVGSAGSLDEEVTPGDLLIGARALQHDAGVNLGRRFVHLGVQVCADGRRRVQRAFAADPDLLAAAQEAGQALLPDDERRPARIHLGPVASGDQVLFSPERKEWIRTRLGALAVDMESGAVAQVAQANGVPWVALRGISDMADDEAGVNLGRLVEYVEDGGSVAGWVRAQGRRLAYLARHPDAPAKYARLARGVQLAAERAAALAELTIRRL